MPRRGHTGARDCLARAVILLLQVCIRGAGRCERLLRRLWVLLGRRPAPHARSPISALSLPDALNPNLCICSRSSWATVLRQKRPALYQTALPDALDPELCILYSVLLGLLARRQAPHAASPFSRLLLSQASLGARLGPTRYVLLSASRQAWAAIPRSRHGAIALPISKLYDCRLVRGLRRKTMTVGFSRGDCWSGATYTRCRAC